MIKREPAGISGGFLFLSPLTAGVLRFFLSRLMARVFHLAEQQERGVLVVVSRRGRLQAQYSRRYRKLQGEISVNEKRTEVNLRSLFPLQGVVGFVDVADELKRGADGGIGRLAQGVNRCRASGTLGGNRRP